MKAIVLSAPGGTENLVYTDVPVPAVQANQVLIKVKSIGLNPVDYKTRVGGGIYNYGGVSTQQQLILGWDIAGVVTKSKSDLFNPGDEVFGMVNFPGVGSAYAEYVAAPAAHLAKKPANISFEEAAAATLAPLTAWQVMVHHAGIKPGQRVLIHAAAGGVGHYAVQLAKTLGAYVIGTSSAANRDFVLALGADEHIDYNTQSLKETTQDIDFVLDSLGPQNIEASLEVIKKGGQIISIVSQFNEDLLKKADSKNIKAAFVLVQSNGADQQILASQLESGALKSHVSKVYAFNEMQAAHHQLETGRTVGKLVVNL